MNETRHVVEHTSLTSDREKFPVITIYEPGIKREQIKKENRYSKKWGVLAAIKGHARWVKPIA